MNENEEAARKAVESSDLALWQAYCQKKEELEELQEKFHSACWLLREAAEELGRIDYPDKNYPQTSIEEFLQENDK
jgi:hypothetical protein